MVSSRFFTALALSLLVPAQRVLGVWIQEPSASAVGACHNITLVLKGVPPFTVNVYPGCDEDDQTDLPLSSHTTSSFNTTWVINQAAGKSVQFGVTDAKNNSWYTEDYPVLDSGIDSCKNSFDTWRDPTAATGTDSVSTTTVAIGNAGAGTATGSIVSSATVVSGGALNGAFSSYAPRTEMAAVAAAVALGALTLL